MTDAAESVRLMYLDESKPLIHNEHLYKSMVKMTIKFF